MILGLQLDRLKPKSFAAPEHFILKLGLRQERRQAGRPNESSGVYFQSFSDEVVLTAIVLHDWEGNDDGPLDAILVHPAQQRFRGRDSAAMQSLPDVGVRVEDAKAVPHPPTPA
jgi:hypothetical protein